jgi:8-oxo-dGTP pyrophosphatase MutT (NUDIX family)
MTKVFLDTEFIDDSDGLELISLALVAETSAEYYAIFAETDISRMMSHAWLRANVVPHLPITAGSRGWDWDTAHPEYRHVKPRAQIAGEVRAFVAQWPDPEIWAWYSPFDAVLLCRLYGPMSDLPAEIPAFTRDLMQEADRLGTSLPEQNVPVHHALSDARHDLRIAAALGLIERSRAHLQAPARAVAAPGEPAAPGSKGASPGVIKESTASTFIFRLDGGTWRTALVWHSRLACWLPAGGHVEPDETTAEAAVREALEETGLTVRLLLAPALSVPLGFPHRPVPAPWWVAEFSASPDRHTSTRHVHVDYVFAAMAEDAPAVSAEHSVRWFTAEEIATADGISEDSRLLAAELLRHLIRHHGTEGSTGVLCVTRYQHLAPPIVSTVVACLSVRRRQRC